MIHPSYVELMQVVNSDQTEIGEEPVINSRYSIVIATAKRARQIIGGDEPMIAKSGGRKPLSVAVQELYEGKVKIVGEDDSIEEITDKKRFSDMKDGSEHREDSGMPDAEEMTEISEMTQFNEPEEPADDMGAEPVNDTGAGYSQIG